MKIIQFLYDLYYQTKKFGFNASSLGMTFKTNFGKGQKVIKFAPRNYAYPIYLRKNSSDVWTFNQVMLKEEYNIDFKTPPKVIVDCGANIGMTTVYLKNKYPEAKIICIEPESSNYDMLLKNVSSYRDVIPLKAGIWDKTTHLIIENPEGHYYGFTVKETDSVVPDSIKAVSVQDIIDEYKLERIDVLKMDIEGSEKKVFSGDYNWLSKVGTLIIELHDRMKEGCSQAFLNAMMKYDFSMELHGENLIFRIKH